MCPGPNGRTTNPLSPRDPDCRATLSQRRSYVPPRSRDAMRPRFARNLALVKTEGAGKTGCALHPRSRVQLHTTKRTRAYRFSGNTPAFPAQWSYGLYRALPGDRLSCHRRLQITSRKLDASIGASGPHDFAVRFSAVVSAPLDRSRDQRTRPAIALRA